MKKYHKIIPMLFLSAFLVACQPTDLTTDPGDNESSQEKVASQSESSSKSEETDNSSEAEEQPELTWRDKLNLYDQAFDSMLNNVNKMAPHFYTFYDIDGNGVDELLTASDYNESGNLSLDNLYYLKDGETPELLGELYASPVGGQRKYVHFHTDGSIFTSTHSSGTGEAEAALFVIKPDQSGLDILDETSYNLYENDFQFPLIEGREEFDINGLRWHDFSEIREEKIDSQEVSLFGQTGMDVSAIAQGDLTSIAGTWRNGEGYELVFDETGFATDGLVLTHPEIREDGSLMASASPTTGGGGFAVFFVPAGVVLEPWIQDIDDFDGSDPSRDRIWGGHSFIFQDPDDFYYRVDE